MSTKTPEAPPADAAGAEPSQPRPERDETDRKLKEERAQTDEHLAQKGTEVQEDAEEVLRVARERADAVLDIARHEADATTPLVTAASELEAARASEDLAVAGAREHADDQLDAERDAEKRASARLLKKERDQTDERLLSERHRADHALASRDDFLAIVSHDLRGILAGLSMSADLLATLIGADAVAEPARVEARRIGRLTRRMNSLIGDLLDVVSMESGRLAVEPSEQDARNLVAAILENFQLAAEARRIVLNGEMPDLALDLQIDHNRILQVLSNLVGNALKFTPDGGTIVVGVARCGSGDVRFTVRDTGPGIPPDRQESIFERFSQLVEGDRRGLGLGLYIARCIVEAHGGKIWVESRPGGSAFHFELPGNAAGAAA